MVVPLDDEDAFDILRRGLCSAMMPSLVVQQE